MSKKMLFISDAVAIALVTFAGFAFHGETDASILPRFLLSYVPLTVAWFIIAPLLGLYQPEITSNPKQLWRPALAMIFAAPLAALSRANILGSMVIPVFANVLAATSALGMVVWRGIYLFMKTKRADT
ncbi:MAG: DUF3054 domain-containing protein [Anaerolineae bacterium]|nr:DUF3054 domain-containing protein [Anaerolineae bacterium]MBL8106473.1 DUF3054 domain-containing protein [Anaerolineales bacterium]MCC7190616.1 DUF3054 domain-containing protein [Anaerolineales bacterium]